MATEATQPNAPVNKLTVVTEQYETHGWTIESTKSHILHSICTSNCSERNTEPCLLCLYTKTLELPHLPEMVFPKNVLRLSHKSGCQIELNALDALKRVSSTELPMKVACSDEWKESRPSEHLEEKIKPFDWTFTTDYKGTISGTFHITPTDERIDLNRLKQKEAILFYQELTLYEDELHDHGISSCTIKIRVMPSSFFILMRFFLRIDNVIVRLNDTRIYHDFTTNYVLREYSNRECGYNELRLSLSDYSDANILAQHMPLNSTICDKLIFDNNETL